MSCVVNLLVRENFLVITLIKHGNLSTTSSITDIGKSLVMSSIYLQIIGGKISTASVQNFTS